MLNLTVHGARISMTIGFLATLMTVLLGAVIGIVVGLRRRAGSTPVLMRLTDFFLVLPTFVLAVLLAPIILDIIGDDAEILGVKATLVVIVIVIGLTSWASTARIIRSQTLSVRERMFVDRARVIGSGPGHIMRRHILPNVTNLIVANTVLTFAAAIFTETTLAFIGLGDPFAPSWGQLLNAAQDGRRAEPRRVVVHRPAGHLRRPRHPRLHPGRERARRRDEPEGGRTPMMRMPTGPDETGKVMEDVELEAAERDAEIALARELAEREARAGEVRRGDHRGDRRRPRAGRPGPHPGPPPVAAPEAGGSRGARCSSSGTCGRTSSSSRAGSRRSTE